MRLWENINKRVLLIVAVPVLFSCQKSVIKENAGVNKWVHTMMQERYLWSGTLGNYIPSDMHPTDYLDYLRYRHDPNVSLSHDIYGDRFSTVVRLSLSEAHSRNPDTFLLSAEDYSNDFGFSYVIDISGNCHISTVVPGSPAYIAGLRRGDIILDCWAGDTKLSWSSFANQQNIRLNRKFPREAVIDLSKEFYHDTPVIFDSVYDLAAGKTGYLVYNHFSAGDNDCFNNELKNVISDFKSRGITNLILDLRYNGGGELNTAILLASMLARPADRGALFIYLERNKHAGQPYYNYEARNFMTADEIGGDQYCLDLDKLVILSTNMTASASELLLHGLKPFYGDDLIHIGEKTYGKNLGTVKLINPHYEWELNIVSLRVFDKTGISGFEHGIDVDEQASDWTLLQCDEPYQYIFGDFGIIDEQYSDNMLLHAVRYLEYGPHENNQPNMRTVPMPGVPEYLGIKRHDLIEGRISAN